MMMRKIALPLTLLGTAMLAQPLYAADGNINVTGQVREGTCRVDDESKNIIVDFGTRLGNSVKHESGASEKSGRLHYWTALWILYVLNLKVMFHLTMDDLLCRIIMISRAASNVSFYIYDENYKYIAPNDYLDAGGLNTGAGSRNVIPFTFGVSRLDKNKFITVGKANVNIQISVAYN